MSYLKVFDVWKGNPNGDHCPGIIVCEIKTFTHFASADSNEQCPIYIGKKNKTFDKKTGSGMQYTREWRMTCRMNYYDDGIGFDVHMRLYVKPLVALLMQFNFKQKLCDQWKK